MLDINYIRANRQKVEDAIKNKGYEIDLAEILDLDDERKSLSQKIDNLRQERNQVSAKMKTKLLKLLANRAILTSRQRTTMRLAKSAAGLIKSAPLKLPALALPI